MLGKGGNRAIREVNRSIILDLVRRGGRISRTELARRSKLTKPTVSAIVDELLGEGVVRELEALQRVTYSLITERRRHRPAGAEGGEPGACGRNPGRRVRRRWPASRLPASRG